MVGAKLGGAFFFRVNLLICWHNIDVQHTACFWRKFVIMQFAMTFKHVFQIRTASALTGLCTVSYTQLTSDPLRLETLSLECMLSVFILSECNTRKTSSLFNFFKPISMPSILLRMIGFHSLKYGSTLKMLKEK